MDFDQQPFIVIWETTQACDLACVHCRAEAQPYALPGQLTTAEGLDLIEQVAQLGTKVLVFSGGDPLKRVDLLELIRHGKSCGLRVGTIPAATPLLTLEVVRALKDAGLDQMALSLDASTEEAHDGFRRVPGAFQKTMEAVAWAHEAEVPLQINTVISLYNFADMDRLIDVMPRLGIVFWEVFFLVPMGRGAHVAGLSAEQCERVFAKLYNASRTASFVIKVTEGLHYRRYVLQRQRREQGGPIPHALGVHWQGQGPGGSIGVSPQTVNAGKGHCFISHTGEVYPSGFLPLSVGNIRAHRLAELYRQAPLFQELRDPALLKGRCGACEFRVVCGGSRARAYAMTSDYLAEDPCCAYQPLALQVA